MNSEKSTVYFGGIVESEWKVELYPSRDWFPSAVRYETLTEITDKEQQQWRVRQLNAAMADYLSDRNRIG